MTAPQRRGVAVLALTFALGTAAGLGLAPILRGPPPAPGLEGLELRADQRARIDAILDAHGPEVEAVLERVRPELHALQERVATEIAAELDAEQRAAFERLRAEHGPPPPR